MEDFKKFLPEIAVHARTQAAASAQSAADGVVAAVGEITAENPTVESQLLASSPTSSGRTPGGASASFVPDNTDLAEDERPTDQGRAGSIRTTRSRSRRLHKTGFAT
jgi:hypothetical protein